MNDGYRKFGRREAIRVAVIVFFAVLLSASEVLPVYNFTAKKNKPVSESFTFDTQGQPTLGERLTYDVYWMGLHVGYGQVAVAEKLTVNGKEITHVIASAKTNEVLSRLYPVDDRIESFFESNKFYSLRFRKKLSEGRYRADEETQFDPYGQKGLYTSLRNGSKKEFPAQSYVKDIVSAFYWFRCHPVKIGDIVKTDVSSEEKDYGVEMHVLSRQTKELRGKRVFDTILVEPRTKLKGVFYSRGRAWIYFSTDYKRLPVWITFKTPFGPVTGVLRNTNSTK